MKINWTAVASIVAILSLILNGYLGFVNHSLNQQISIINNGQNNGIMANELNFGSQDRHITEVDKQNINLIITSLNPKGVYFVMYTQDGEAQRFAREISLYLIQQGLKIYPSSSVYSNSPSTGWQVRPTLDSEGFLVVDIGSNPN